MNNFFDTGRSNKINLDAGLLPAGLDYQIPRPRVNPLPASPFPKLPVSSTTPTFVEDTDAYWIMRGLNQFALIQLNGNEVAIAEDWIDSDEDGNVYEMGYFSTTDGQHAQAFCLRNPWDPKRYNAGYSPSSCHCYENGNLCVGSGKHNGPLHKSAYTLEHVVKVGRYWCTAFTCLKQHGYFPQP